MPGIGVVEHESKVSMAKEAPLDTAVEAITQRNDFQTKTDAQAEAAVRTGDAVDPKDRAAAAAISDSNRIRAGEMIEGPAARFQMERTLTANTLFDQQTPPLIDTSTNLSGSSSAINSFIAASTFAPTLRDLRNLGDTTIGRPRPLEGNRTTEMHVRELPGSVFS